MFVEQISQQNRYQQQQWRNFKLEPPIGTVTEEKHDVKKSIDVDIQILNFISNADKNSNNDSYKKITSAMSVQIVSSNMKISNVSANSKQQY